MEFVQPIRDKKKIEDMKKILRRNLRDYALFVLGINSALRISDILKLTVSDVWEKKGKFRDRISIREKKTGKAKSFPLSEAAKKALKEYLDTRTGVELNEPLFPSRKGRRPLTRQQAYRILNAAAASVGIKDPIGTHTLRKTFAYHAYTAGYSLEMIMKLLNHSAPSVTLAYIGITQDQMDDVYLTLNL